MTATAHPALTVSVEFNSPACGVRSTQVQHHYRIWYSALCLCSFSRFVLQLFGGQAFLHDEPWVLSPCPCCGGWKDAARTLLQMHLPSGPCTAAGYATPATGMVTGMPGNLKGHPAFLHKSNWGTQMQNSSFSKCSDNIYSNTVLHSFVHSTFIPVYT